MAVEEVPWRESLMFAGIGVGGILLFIFVMWLAGKCDQERE